MSDNTPIPSVDIINNLKSELLIYLAVNENALSDELKTKFYKANCRLRYFSSVNDFVSAIENEVPHVFMIDIDLAENKQIAAKVIKQLKAMIKKCPPVIFIADTDHVDERLAAARAGACRYFPRPVNSKRLMRTITTLAMPVDIESYRVLLVDDDESILRLNSAILSNAGITVETLSKPLDIFKVMPNFKPDVIVIDIYMPDCSGTELAKMIRQNDIWSLIPIMFLSAEDDLDKRIEAMDTGGDDFLLKPMEPAYLVAAITARAKRARKSIRLNNRLKETLRENKFQLITMDQHDIVSSADVTGKITSVNDRFCEISGYSREELIGQNHRLLKSTSHSKEFFKDMWRHLNKGKVWRGTICNYKKNGEEYWVESTIVPFIDEKGKPYKYVSARTDVTELRKSEERLHRSQTFANIGTWDWNIETGELFWSDRIGPLFGYDKDVPETNYDNFIAAVHEEDREMVMAAVKNCVKKGIKYNIEHRVVWPDGSVHWVQEKGDVVRSEGGKPLHMLGVVQDINKLKQVQLNLIDARDEAEDANLAKSQFLSSMSHELRTPMNAILGFGQLLKMEADGLTESQDENIDEIIKAGHHLLELINEVLDLSRIESGRMSLSLESIDINEVLMESLQLIMPSAKKRNIDIILKQDGDEISLEELLNDGRGVLADRVRLRQVLLNLLSNAVKYNSENGSIIIACSTHQHKRRLSITDSGNGLSDEQKAHLFTAFERMGAEQTEVEGTGIGLVITKEIIELMDGAIGVESQEGKGCTFWIELPIDVLPAEGECNLVENELNERASIKTIKNERHVLYIEDNPANLRLVSQLLGRLPHIHLLTAREPMLGLELASEHKLDLILLDINLPGMNGFEVLEKLRQKPNTCDIPVIAISANAMKTDLEEGNRAGFDEYITKPIDVRALLHAVDSRLSGIDK